MKAFILVGLQIDFGPGGAVEIPGSNTIIPTVNLLMPRFDLVIAANYWLPANHQLFAANHPWRKPGQILNTDGHSFELKTMFCVQDSFGAELLPGLGTEKIRFVAKMGTSPDAFPYSAFSDTGNKQATGLEVFLKRQKVKQVYIAGMPLEHTVKNTALDAIKMGYSTFIFSDVVKESPGANKKETLAQMSRKGIQILTAVSF